MISFSCAQTQLPVIEIRESCSFRNHRSIDPVSNLLVFYNSSQNNNEISIRKVKESLVSFWWSRCCRRRHRCLDGNISFLLLSFFLFYVTGYRDDDVEKNYIKRATVGFPPSMPTTLSYFLSLCILGASLRSAVTNEELLDSCRQIEMAGCEEIHKPTF